MNFKFSSPLLSRDEVISEAFHRLKGGESTDSYEDTEWVFNCVAEVVCDPYDTLNHKIPAIILNDENKLSDYLYLIACDVKEQLNLQAK
jgi:hypothetical protein